MGEKVDIYIVTGNNYPAWVGDASRRGLVRVSVDEDGEFDKIVVETNTGRKFAKIGDVLVKTRTGISVLTGEQAKKYKVVPKNMKVEVKQDENE